MESEGNLRGFSRNVSSPQEAIPAVISKFQTPERRAALYFSNNETFFNGMQIISKLKPFKIYI